MNKWLVLMRTKYGREWEPDKWFDWECDAVEYIARRLLDAYVEAGRLVRVQVSSGCPRQYDKPLSADEPDGSGPMTHLPADLLDSPTVQAVS